MYERSGRLSLSVRGRFSWVELLLVGLWGGWAVESSVQYRPRFRRSPALRTGLGAGAAGCRCNRHRCLAPKFLIFKQQ